MLINKTKEQDVFKIFLRGRRNWNILLRSGASCWECSTVWKWFGFVVEDWFKVKIVWLYNLKLEKEMTNILKNAKNFLIVFLHFLHFIQSGTHSFSVHFMNSITHSASPPPPLSSSFSHNENFAHHPVTIHSNNPFSSLSHSANKGCIKGPMSEGVSWGLTLSWSYPASLKHGKRYMRSQSLIPHCPDSENWHITSSSLWRRY